MYTPRQRPRPTDTVEATGFDVVDGQGNLLDHRRWPEEAMKRGRELSEWRGIKTVIIRQPDGVVIGTLSVSARREADRLAGYPQNGKGVI